MTGRVKLLKELVGDGLYVIDDTALAEALLVRWQRAAPAPRRSRFPWASDPHRGCGRSARTPRRGPFA